MAKLSPPILILQLARAGPGLCPMEFTVRERRASYSSLKEQRKMFQGGGRKNLGEKKDISEELEVQEGFFLLYDDGGEDSEKEDSGYFCAYWDGRRLGLLAGKRRMYLGWRRCWY